MIARTLGQHAVPTTFATVTGRWCDGLAAGRRRPRPHGPPAGRGSAGRAATARRSGRRHAAIVARASRQRLELDVGPGRAARPAGVDRPTWPGRGALAAAACAKVGLDVVLLAQDDVGEVAEQAARRRRVVVDAAQAQPDRRHLGARAAAMQVPGLVATLLTAAGSGEVERAAGAWHAEWPALHGLLRATGSAVHWLRRVAAPARRRPGPDGRQPRPSEARQRIR